VIAVLVPALDRPGRVAPLAESLRSASVTDPRLLYLTSPHDDATREACRAAGVSYVTTPFELAGGDYARKVNYGVTLTEEPWLFQAGDDIAFHRGWDDIVLKFAEQHEAARVVGTNDMGNPLVKAGAHTSRGRRCTRGTGTAGWTMS
jgi:GTP:adenosylcobinamide-phosphate guanylyltransferase